MNSAGATPIHKAQRYSCPIRYYVTVGKIEVFQHVDGLVSRDNDVTLFELVDIGDFVECNLAMTFHRTVVDIQIGNDPQRYT